MQYNTIPYHTIQYNTIQYNTIKYNAMQCNTIQYNTIQYNILQCNTIPYHTIQYNIKMFQDEVNISQSITFPCLSLTTMLDHLCVRGDVIVKEYSLRDTFLLKCFSLTLSIYTYVAMEEVLNLCTHPIV